jgi:hypothetical protein
MPQERDPAYGDVTHTASSIRPGVDSPLVASAMLPVSHSAIPPSNAADLCH